jgi:prepilin-type processing-associated H-X9-DG protein
VQDRHSDPGDGAPDNKYDTNGGNRWGSAHNNSFNMVFCDGAVHSIPYNIDLKVHQSLASRNDGKTPKYDF